MILIERKFVRAGLFGIVALLILMDILGPLVGIESIFALDKQGSVSVWFESVLYLISAGLLGLISIHYCNRGNQQYWRWGLFSIFMVYLSVNAASEINKKLVGKITDWLWWIGSSFFDFILFLLLATALIVILWPVLTSMPARVRRMLIWSGIIFGFGAIVIDDLSDLLFRGNNGWFYIFEEMLEYSGFILFIDAILTYLQTEINVIKLDFSSHQPPDENGR